MLTYQVEFSFILHAIKKYAFKYSSFPLIVNLDNHCSPQQLKLVLKQIHDIFGSSLQFIDSSQLHSPRQLHNKILLCDKVLFKAATQDDENVDVELEKHHLHFKQQNIHHLQQYGDLITMDKSRKDDDSTHQLKSPGYKFCENLADPLDNRFYLHEIIQESLETIEIAEVVYCVTDWISLKGLRQDVKQRTKKYSEHVWIRG